MSIHNQPGKPELRVVDGGGEEDKESRLRRARSAVESALDLRHQTEATGRRTARQIDAPGMYEGTSALDDRPMPVRADGEVDARYHRIRDARLDVEAAHDDMPQPVGIGQLEDLFK